MTDSPISVSELFTGRFVLVLSFTPGFSPVSEAKELVSPALCFSTGLKPGVNEKKP
jgi:hypothetical protein